MATNYPYASVAFFVLATLIIATCSGAVLARLGFPLPEGRRIGCVDGLRGYLAIAVFTSHALLWVQMIKRTGEWGDHPTAMLNQLGNGAVGLFFMVSGLVFYPYIRKGFSGTSWVSIYTSRIFRIMPLVGASVLIIVLIISTRTGRVLQATDLPSLGQWLIGYARPPLMGYAKSWLVNAGVLWSIWYEWVFYVALLPALAVLSDAIRGRFPTCTLPLLAIAIGVLSRAAHLPIKFLAYLPLFAVGMLAYEIQRKERVSVLLRTRMASAAATASLLIGMNVADTPTATALPFFAFLFVCVACGNTLFGLLNTKGALVLGECSFGIYVLHAIVLYLLFEFGGAGELSYVGLLTAALPFVSVLIVILCAFTFLLIERPSISLGRMVARSIAAKQVAPAQVEVAP